MFGWFSAAAACASILKRWWSSSLAAILARQEFDGDVAFEFGVLGFVNDPHAACAEFFDNFVVKNCLADHFLSLRVY